MEISKAKVDQLNGDEGSQLIIHHDICGDFSIVRHFNQRPMSPTSTNQLQVSLLRRVVNNDIEVSIIAPPNHSLASNIDDRNITATDDIEDSDYVSTLRDPNEEQ